jgi:predicted amidohydrolase YtcJ
VGETPLPKGAEITKNKDGSPRGLLVDVLLPELDKVAALGKVTKEQFVEAWAIFQKDCAEKGITSVNGLGIELKGTELWGTIDELAKQNKLTLRTNLAYSIIPGQKTEEVIKEMKKGKEKYISDYQNITTVKLFVDGVVEGKTGVLIEPYAPGAEMPKDYKGTKIWQDEELFNSVAAYDKEGFQMHIHAIADGGVQQALNSLENAQKLNGKRDARHALAHVTLIADQDMQRMADMKVIAAMQPVWFYKDPIFSQLEKQMLGEERFKKMYRLRDMLDKGVMLTGSADNPVTMDYAPLSGIEVGVTQCSPYEGQDTDPSFIRDANQTLTLDQMLEAYTVNGAYLIGMEDKVGSLKVGEKADMVILGEDITKVQPNKISETPVLYTIMDGNIVYKK